MFDTTQHLVEQVGHSLMVKLHLNHLAQVGIHQLHHEVPEEKVGSMVSARAFGGSRAN